MFVTVMSDKKYSRNPDAPKQNTNKLAYIMLAFFSIGFIALVLVAALSLLSAPIMGDCIAVVEINGEITTQSSPTSMFTQGSYGSYELSQKISELNDDENVAGVLLVINSPGGSVVGSDEIYRAVDSLDKPKVAYFREIAASGGYYISTPTDYIISEPNALTGSIGTVMYLAEFEELADKLGIHDRVIKSGAMKDIGNPMRNMTEDEENLLHLVIDEAFAGFKSKITMNRGSKLNYALYTQALDGRVLSATMAQKAGLVDELGSRDDALMKTAELANLSFEDASDIHVCKIRTSPESPGLFDMHSLIGGLFATDSVPSLKYR